MALYIYVFFITYLSPRTDAHSKFSEDVKTAKDVLTDSERISGKWNKDDRNKVNSLCTEKLEWLSQNLEVMASVIIEQHQDFEEKFKPYLAKLTPVVI